MDEIKGKILWVDDEIELLHPHILFLQQKGFGVETATNGDDALAMVNKGGFDLVLLDEMMPGKGGLQTLSDIKSLLPGLPVVMITKNEEESLMEDAIGGKISDYLTKPVNPSQVLLTCKKILEGKKITGEYVSKDYTQEFQEISRSLMNPLTHEEWIDLHVKMTNWELELDRHPELGLQQLLSDQKRDCNVEFSRFIERNYQNWLEKPEKAPTLSVNIAERYLLPKLDSDKSVFFFVIDCLRLDQWLIMEEVLREWFTINKEYYYSILPTATPYARNAIFSGLFPLDIQQRYSEYWTKEGDEDENSFNRFEHQLFEKLLERKRISLKPEAKYVKILDAEFGRSIENNILSYARNRLTLIVVNFIDMLAHGRSDSEILKEIAPNESAYRSLTRSWFMHSSLLGMLKTLSEKPNVRIVLTTDHGSIRSLHGTKVIGDKDASTSLRYKFGRNLKIEEKGALFIKNPKDFRLPQRAVTTNYVVAKEDYFFLYPTEYHKHLAQYRDSFQHGGISMEEMILPVVWMEPK
jgi:DNA-binding response OmpR family regulator